MILSKRERYIAIGSAAAIGLLVINWLVLDPYTEQNERTHADLSSVNSKLNQAEVTFAAQKRLLGIWSEMQAGGLKADASQAESEAHQRDHRIDAILGRDADSIEAGTNDDRGKVPGHRFFGDGQRLDAADIATDLQPRDGDDPGPAHGVAAYAATRRNRRSVGKAERFDAVHAPRLREAASYRG